MELLIIQYTIATIGAVFIITLPFKLILLIKDKTLGLFK